MPITLGCPSCGKRFRARDESAGKRVKCPFCQAAVSVPSADEARAAGAPTEAVPGPPMSSVTAPPLARSSASVAPPPPRPVPAAPADEWRPEPTPAFTLLPEDPPPPPPAATVARGTKPPPAYEPPPRGPKPAPTEASQGTVVAGWKRARAGLCWVLFALFWFALLGAVPFGKLVYERAVGELPKGDGWVKIDGYVNTDGPDAVKLTKTEELNLLLYGAPVLLGGLALVFGRITAGAAPRNSGAKGLFAFSGLATLVAAVGVGTVVVCDKLLFAQVGGYARLAVVVSGGLGEFWFLLALAAAGATVRRPRAVRAVGFFALVIGLAVVVVAAGWDAYLKYGPDLGVPKVKDADWLFYEAAAKMLGWLLVVGTYWRAVSAVRGGIRDHVEDVAAGTARPA